MKRVGVNGCAWLLMASVAWGQSVDMRDLDPAEKERIRIESVRQQITADLDAEDAACLARFAVTDCQSKVSARRRKVMADLKRQEGALNAEQRRQKGIDQMRNSSEKAAASAAREAELQSVPATQQQDDRRKSLDEKILNHQRQANPVASKASASNPLDPKQVEKKRDAYLEKQNAVEKRRRERDQRLLDHGKGGPPLPAEP
jgi:hypothetical protein